jgi:colanic acid biosynthesis glycosyl transferase WcaI
MKILILAHFYPPEMGGAAARLHGLARWLVRLGHHVTVITGMPNYPTGVVPAPYRHKLRVREEMDGVDVLRTWVYASAFRSSVRRLANYFSFVVSATLAGLGAGRGYDVILASSPPPFVGLTGLFLARLRRIPLVFDIRDIWPEVAIEAGEFSADAPLARWGWRLAHFLYRHADHITPVTASKRSRLLASGVPQHKLTVVTNGADLDLVPASPADKRVELELQGKFVVLYAGLLGVAQGVEVAVEAAEILRAQQDVHFLIVGDGRRQSAIAARVKELNLNNVTLLPRQPREAMPAFLATADACLVPLANDSLEDAVPSKLLEAWAHSRPVILAAAGEAAHIVDQSGGGVVVAPGDPAALAEAVLALRDNPERCRCLAEQGHAHVATRYDRRLLAQQMEHVLQETISARRSRPRRGC